MSATLISDKLKAALLQSAIQGKLTQQRPEDGDARDLLKQIKAEKERLINEKVIKKEKPLPEITEDEIPFDIPDNWVWVRMIDLCLIITDGTHHRPKYTVNGIPFLSVKNITKGFLDLENTKFISEIEHRQLIKRCHPQKGDLLLSKVGTTGVPLVIDTDIEFSIFVSLALLKLPKQIYNHFLCMMIQSPLAQKQVKSETKGVGNKNWVLRDISKMVIPLPPLTEQHRIVEAIETALAKIDKLKVDETKLYNIQKAFPTKLRASLLQSAIQGKLTQQLPEDGDARDLLKQIRAEKERLINEKVIKKEKPLPEITEDEIPFDIPDNWVWVYLQNIVLGTEAGKSPRCETKHVNINQWGVLTTTSIQKNLFLEDENKILPNSFLINHAIQVKKQDLLITRAGPTNRTGVACVVRDIKYKLILSDKTVRILYVKNKVNPNYLSLFINSEYGIEQVKDLATGMDKQQVNLSQDRIKSLKIALPPLAEQHRIVKVIEMALTKIDKLNKLTE